MGLSDQEGSNGGSGHGRQGWRACPDPRSGLRHARRSGGGVRGWRSFMTMKLNMFSLIAMGVAAAYLFSLVAVVAPGIFPAGFRDEAGEVGVYFEAAAVIVVLVLLGQVLELRAREETG